MRISIDTNRYTDFWNGVPEVVDVIEEADAIYMPFAVIAELRSGFLNGSRRAENDRVLTEFLQKPDVYALFPDDVTTIHYASFHQQLRINGTPIPVNDIWIAAVTFQHALTLYARDKHFDHLPQVMRL